MKKFRLLPVSILMLSGILSTTVAYAYTSLEGGKLFFNGYQTDTAIVSEIGDTDYTDNYKYSVEAIVYVGNTRYGTGWKNDYAKISKGRKWYANETSRYNYVRR